MKKNHLKVLALSLLLPATFAVQSCNNGDDDPITPVTPVGIAANPNDFKGDVKSGEVVTLDATKVYKLTVQAHLQCSIMKTGNYILTI